MAISWSIAQHCEAYPSRVLARDGGKYIFNIRLTEDTDNGNFVARGTYLGIDEYEQAAATTFSGIVREKAPNGNYYVEVVDPGDALFVYQVPMIEEEYSEKFKSLKNFYNLADDVVRCYELAKGDILEISEAGFTATPVVGATVALSGKKLA